MEGELSGGVIVSAGEHHGVDSSCLLGCDVGFLRQRVGAAVGEVEHGTGEFFAAHSDGTLFEVGLYDGSRFIVEVFETLHKVG